MLTMLLVVLPAVELDLTIQVPMALMEKCMDPVAVVDTVL